MWVTLLYLHTKTDNDSQYWASPCLCYYFHFPRPTLPPTICEHLRLLRSARVFYCLEAGGCCPRPRKVDALLGIMGLKTFRDFAMLPSIIFHETLTRPLTEGSRRLFLVMLLTAQDANFLQARITRQGVIRF